MKKFVIIAAALLFASGCVSYARGGPGSHKTPKHDNGHQQSNDGHKRHYEEKENPKDEKEEQTQQNRAQD